MVIKLFSGNYARDLGASFGSTINLSNDDNNSVEPDIADHWR